MILLIINGVSVMFVIGKERVGGVLDVVSLVVSRSIISVRESGIV